MRSSSAVTVAHRSRSRQNFFAPSVLTADRVRFLAGEYRRELTGPFGQMEYGAKVGLPGEITRLVKRVNHGDNHVAETTWILSLAKVALGFPREVVETPFRVGLAMIGAQYPAEGHAPIDDLHELETEIQAAIDPLQVKWLRNDRSTAVKRGMLERFKEYRRVIDRIIDWLERDIYGGSH